MDAGALENLIGYTFADRELLLRALTHRSWAHEHFPSGSDDKMSEIENESLEFVGDSVLGLAVAEWLYRNHPGRNEGDLTMMKHRLVSAATLADTARSMGLGTFIRLGRGELKTGGRTKPAILADALEAVIGAVFFDGGYTAAAKCVSVVFASHLAKATPRASTDFKTMLQEKLQAAKLAAPSYSLVSSEGMPHSRTFVVEAAWHGGRARGTGPSIKSAEMMAASEALNALQLAESTEQDQA